MSVRRRKRTAGNGRFAFLRIAFFVVLLLISARLVQLQVVDASAYAQRASEQRTREITLLPRRGTIYDREGEPLAVSVEARTVYANPRMVRNPVATSQALARVIGGDAASYEAKLRKKAGFVYIARKIDMNRAAALQALDLPGIGLIEDSRRIYPLGDLACQVLGFVGVDDEGLAGLEKQYDEKLAGVPGMLLAERDPFGRPIPGGVVQAKDPIDGQNIILTIDKDIQHLAQAALAEAVDRWDAAGGSIIVMDPNDGSIYAMASYPGFDPNSFTKAKTKTLRNRPITDTFEPGSTVKALTAAASIDKGLYTPDSIFDLPPTIKIGGRTIKEAHPRRHVTWSLAQIVANSSNVGSVKVGMALGPDWLYESFDRFGLTQKTGVDFPGEAQGWLPPTHQWSASTIGTLPFGQGVSVTPLQLARALSTIANGGELPTPHFLQALPDDKGTVLSWPRTRVLKAETSAAMREILTMAVTEGTGGSAAVPGYTVAGKTGTAQKARTDAPGYAPGKYVASFAGFIPAENPRLFILVCIDEPRNAIYGGVVAAPVFSRVAKFSVSHLKIPPANATGSNDDTITPSWTP